MQIIVLEPLCKSWYDLFRIECKNQLHLLSSRFLIEGSKGAVLHTGDFRAEPWFLESLVRNPLLQPYLSPQDQECLPSNPRQPLATTVSTTLEAIYLDTASALSNLQLVTKVRIFFNLHLLVMFNHLSRIALQQGLLNSWNSFLTQFTFSSILGLGDTKTYSKLLLASSSLR
jgi:hypothetical protein